MPLPEPGPGVWWFHYRNTTPAFRLTSVEKPDSSPFLIHMTSKNRLVKILQSAEADEGIAVPENHGFLKSSIPAFEEFSAQHYNAPVVCFTESPIFAVDFFRYRSYRRWRLNQQYGLGFSKEVLAKVHGVRPVIYTDTQTNSTLLTICNAAEAGEITFSENGEMDLLVKNTFKDIKPLLFPLLENEVYQGFMWEREWRSPNPKGMVFPYSSIRIVCCPANEQEEIAAILGQSANNITFVQSWREYDEVTNYLKEREKTYDAQSLDQIDNIEDVTTLEKLREKQVQTLNSLIEYYDVFKGTVDNLEHNNINKTIADLKSRSEKLDQRILKLRQAAKEKSEKEAAAKQKK